MTCEKGRWILVAFHACADRCPKCGGDRNPNPKVTNSRVTINKEKPEIVEPTAKGALAPTKSSGRHPKRDVPKKTPPPPKPKRGSIAPLPKDPKNPAEGDERGNAKATTRDRAGYNDLEALG